MRDHVITELTRLACLDERIYLIAGDLGYVVLDKFREKCPDRFINAGIAEQNMTALAAGMAREGNIVFTYSLGNFPTLRCLEQIRNDVCYHKCRVTIISAGGGIAYGNQGVTHHATEDLAIMRALPNMRVYAPGDAVEAEKCLRDAYNSEQPAYIRLARNRERNLHSETITIDIHNLTPLGKAGKEINILTAGSILSEGVKLQNMLTNAGISTGVFSVPCIKPIDRDGIIRLALSSCMLITIEEHQISGGLGGAVAEVISEIRSPHAYLYRAGLNDQFSEQTGDQEHLREFYGLSAEKLFPLIMREARK